MKDASLQHSPLTWVSRAERVRAGEFDLATAPVDEPIASYHRLFEALFTTSFDAIVLCRPDGTYLAVSDAFCVMTAYRREDLLGRTSTELGLIAGCGSRRGDGTDVAAGRPGLHEMDLRRADGEIRHVEFSHQALGPDYQLAIVRDITARRREEEQLQILASTDPLTGLLNRRSFGAKAAGVLADSRHPVHLLLADLDGLKEINDTHGHAVGDRSLRVFARTLADVAAGAEWPTLVGRLGGDEFAVLVSGWDVAGVRRLADEVWARLAHPSQRLVGGRRISASFGIASRTEDDPDFERLMERADRDLYAAKGRRAGAEPAPMARAD